MSRQGRSTFRHLVLSTVAGASMMLGFQQVADAGEIYLFNDQVPTADEIAQIMFPQAAPRTRGLQVGGEGAAPIRTRGIRFETPPAEAAAAAPPAVGTQQASHEDDAATTVPKGSSVAFNITFAFNSAELTDADLPALEQLGAALMSPQARDKRVVIAGFADASGDAAYNQRLSEARANSVLNYLVGRFGVSPDQLQTVGYGEEHPLPGIDPYDGLNRRVEFQPVD
ncbi:MAG: OmpA family protein [Geminicoccaceae bacterium]